MIQLKPTLTTLWSPTQPRWYPWTPATVPFGIVMNPRSLSPVAAVNVTSNVIRSSFAPMASAIIAADSAKTSLSLPTLSASPGVSGSWENPIAVWVPADS